MKVLIFFSLLVACNCLEIVKNAKPAIENPRVSKVAQKLFSGGNLKESKPSRQGKIVRGNAAELGQFPHQTLLFMNDQAQWYKCGGSFVRFNWVLTVSEIFFNFI